MLSLHRRFILSTLMVSVNGFKRTSKNFSVWYDVNYDLSTEKKYLEDF